MSDEEEYDYPSPNPEEYDFPEEEKFSPEQKLIVDELNDWIKLKKRNKKELRAVNTRRFNKMMLHQEKLGELVGVSSCMKDIQSFPKEVNEVVLRLSV